MLDKEFFYWSNGVVKTHGLEPPQPIMCSTPESGDSEYMFQSGSRYYIWNPMAGTVGEIMTSMDLVDVVTKITKLGLKSSVVAKIHQMSSG